MTDDRGDEQFKALLNTVEKLRAATFPTLEANLVRELLRLHASGLPADAETSRRVEQAVEAQLAKANPAC